MECRNKVDESCQCHPKLQVESADLCNDAAFSLLRDWPIPYPERSSDRLVRSKYWLWLSVQQLTKPGTGGISFDVDTFKMKHDYEKCGSVRIDWNFWPWSVRFIVSTSYFIKFFHIFALLIAIFVSVYLLYIMFSNYLVLHSIKKTLQFIGYNNKLFMLWDCSVLLMFACKKRPLLV